MRRYRRGCDLDENESWIIGSSSMADANLGSLRCSDGTGLPKCNGEPGADRSEHISTGWPRGEKLGKGVEVLGIHG